MDICSRSKTVNLILLAVTIAIGTFLLSNNFFNGANGFFLGEFIGVAVIYLILLAGVILLGRGYFKHFYPLLMCLGAFFILDIVMTCLMKSPQDLTVLGLHGEYWDVHFEISNVFRFESIVKFFAILSMGYLAVVLLPQLIDVDSKLVLILYFVVALALVFTLYSLFSEFNSYVEFVKCFINRDQQGMFLASPKSLFPNKNNFALLLFIEIIACLLLHHYRRHWWFYLLIGVAFIITCFTICKSVIIFDVVLVLGYLIYRFIDTYKDHKKRNLITLSSCLGVVLIALAIILIVPTFRDNLFELFFSIGGRTIELRKYNWSNANQVLGVSGYFTGRGYGVFDEFVKVYNYSDPGGGEGYTINSHNGYLELIGSGGVLFLLLALAIEGYLVYKCIKHFKDERELCIFTLLLLVVLDIYMFLEAIEPVFSHDMNHYVLNVMLFVPVLSLDYKMEYQKVEVSKPSKNNVLLTLLSLVSIGLMSGLFVSKRMWSLNDLNIAFIVVTSVVALLIVGAASYLFLKDKTNLNRLIELFGYLIVISVIWGLVSMYVSTELMIAISVVVSIEAFILLNSLLNKLPLSPNYGEIYNYLANKLNNAFVRSSK